MKDFIDEHAAALSHQQQHMFLSGQARLSEYFPVYPPSAPNNVLLTLFSYCSSTLNLPMQF